MMAGVRTWPALLMGIVLALTHGKPLGAADGEPAFKIIPRADLRSDGPLLRRITAHEQQWLLPLPIANPAMVTALEDSVSAPAEGEIPLGGYAGLYLSAALAGLDLTGTPELRERIGFIAPLAVDRLNEWSGFAASAPRPRGEHGFTEVAFLAEALMRWSGSLGDREGLDAAGNAVRSALRLAAENKDGLQGALVWLAPVTMALYEQGHLEAPDAKIVLDAIGAQNSGSPAAFVEAVKSLGDQGELRRLWLARTLGPMFAATGDPEIGRALMNYWEGMSGGVLPSGAFESNGSESAAVIARLMLALDTLRLSGDSVVADAFEIAFLNAGLAAQHPSGRWWAGEVPMEGTRKVKGHQTARPGAPEIGLERFLAARVFELFRDWAVMQSEEGLALNSFFPGVFQGKLPEGTPVAIQVQGRYPVEGVVDIRIEPVTPRRFQLLIRIPNWADGAVMYVNNRRTAKVRAGEYFAVNRVWRAGDRLKLDLPLRLRIESERDGDRAALYRGPVLLAAEGGAPVIDVAAAKKLGATLPAREGVAALDPWVRLRARIGENEKEIELIDFASAGVRGHRYSAWFPVNDSSAPRR